LLVHSALNFGHFFPIKFSLIFSSFPYKNFIQNSV
jgi:hypothetical protein